MNPQYTNVKVEGPSFPTKGQPACEQEDEKQFASTCLMKMQRLSMQNQLP